jgi:hypothetical protein
MIIDAQSPEHDFKLRTSPQGLATWGQDNTANCLWLFSGVKMEYPKQGGAEDELIFYAQDSTRSTCVKLRNSLIRNGKNCVYSVFTPKPLSVDVRLVIGKLTVASVALRFTTSWVKFGSFSGSLVDGTSTPWSKFLAIEISSIETAKSFPRGRREALCF